MGCYFWWVRISKKCQSTKTLYGNQWGIIKREVWSPDLQTKQLAAKHQGYIYIFKVPAFCSHTHVLHEDSPLVSALRAVTAVWEQLRYSTLTRPFSTSLVVMTMTLDPSCQTICQKSPTVVSRHPWQAMYIFWSPGSRNLFCNDIESGQAKSRPSVKPGLYWMH